MAEQCACDDAAGYRTLLQLRDDVLAGLGFIAPLADQPTKTLLAMRTEILARLGLPDPLTEAATRALSDLRDDLLIRLGNAAMVGATLTPGMQELLDSYINEAQQTLFRRLELDKGGVALPARMTLDADVTTLDYVPVLNLAAALALAHYGKGDAKAHMEVVEKYLADWANRRPPGIADQIDAQLRQAQETVYRRYEFAATGDSALNPLDADTDQTTIDYHPVQLLALANMKARAKQDDAKLVLKDYEQYMADLERQRPANALSLVRHCVKDAQRQIIRRYKSARVDRWFSWTLTAGERFYDLPDNTEQSDATEPCTKLLDPLAIKWVGVSRGTVRQALVNGIPPYLLDQTTTGWPTHYEIKNCIEVWPAPAATEGTLRIRAGFLSTEFVDDEDRPSVDDELVYLLALAGAKEHYKQDAKLAMTQFEVHLQKIVAGSHNTARYLPGDSVARVYVEPRPSVPFAS